MRHLLEGRVGGKVVLVTGGTGGIGGATAIGLAVMGADGAITGRARRRLDGSGVTVTALHPGVVRAAVSAEDPDRLSARLRPLASRS